jgi:tRNA (guanine10-N2)-methyltransferase
MVDPDEEFCIFEDYEAPIVDGSRPQVRGSLKRVYLGRWLAKGSREAVDLHDLKKRNYISTTSMDAGLSLVTANMALASEGKVFYDPFVGTGSFCVAAAHFGAHTYGSDIDGRSFRGKERGKGKSIGLVANLQQYQLESRFMDAFISDLTNSPLRKAPLFDGIVCDPPYGVREGLKVLGTRDGQKKEVVFIDGVPTH